MKSNTEQFKIALKYLGESCPKCCSMSNNCCCYFVSMGFRNAGNASLFYNGKTVTYCPNAIKWCKTMLAQIPPFLAMQSDIVFFDWELNGTPNHIGFADHRIDDEQLATLEGNTTSKYVVARRVRTAKYIQGVFRPHFKATYDISKELKIDGQFNYSSIAMLQSALGMKVNGILTKETVKALQKKVGVTQDGSWGVATSKAVQKMLKKEGLYNGEIDGCVYEGTVKALQKWCNKYGFKKTTASKPTTTPAPQPITQTTADGKLVINGVMEKKAVERMQEFFGTTKDGLISGQKEDLWKAHFGSFSKTVLGFSGKGSECIKKLQKWLGVKQDGLLGVVTIKAWQKKLGVTEDGSFGTESCKAWQKYLNEHDKAVFPKTLADKFYDQVVRLAWANDTDESKWLYKTGAPRDSYKDALKAQMGHTSKVAQSDCGYLIDTIWRIMGYKDALVLKGNKDAFPSVPKDYEVVFKGKVVPDGFLKRSDIVRYKKKSGSQHTYAVVDANHIAEAGRKVRFPVIRTEKANAKCNASNVKHGTIEVIRAK